MGFSAGRSRIGLVKGVVPMPKLPESGHRDKSGHCCIAQLFGVGASGSPGSQGTGSLPQAATALRTSRGRPDRTIVRGYTPGSRLFSGACCLRESICTIVRFYIPGSRLVLAAVSRQLSPGRLAQLCGFFLGGFQAAASLSTRHTLKKKLLTLYNIYGNLWYSQNKGA